MTEPEKAAAFDLLAAVLTNRWHDGSWSWWCPTPCGGKTVATPEEAVADLLEWAGRVARLKRKTPPEGKTMADQAPSGCTTGGFTERFRVERTDGRACRPQDRFVVLNLGLHPDGTPIDPFAREAMWFYASLIRGANPTFAADVERGLRDGFPASLAQHKDAR